MVQYIEQLKNLIQQRALKTGIKVRLAGGGESNYYINCKTITLHGPSLHVLSAAVADFFEGRGWPGFVAGVCVGGDPFVAGVILEANQRGHSLEALLVRKEPKDHGGSQGKAVEGHAPEGLDAGFLIEDVVSTGGSSLKAAKFLLQEGYKLSGVLCIVDREMGGVQTLQSELGVPVFSLFRVSELL